MQAANLDHVSRHRSDLVERMMRVHQVQRHVAVQLGDVRQVQAEVVLHVA